jgi:hypothetical protein
MNIANVFNPEMILQTLRNELKEESVNRVVSAIFSLVLLPFSIHVGFVLAASIFLPIYTSI